MRDQMTVSPYAEDVAPPMGARYSWVRVLWIRVIIRSVYDFVLWRESPDIKLRKWAQESEKWLFEPSDLNNSLESICYFIDIDVEGIRKFARLVTRDQVKKMEFIERQKGKDPARALLDVLGEKDSEEVVDGEGR